ncbi:MAG: hypothetical protein ACD_79C00716G0002 [uncultured bacterium]|nr:MAG: hypothetical protein ACD_79C00716G0002 [uncultured bacterium]
MSDTTGTGRFTDVSTPVASTVISEIDSNTGGSVSLSSLLTTSIVLLAELIGNFRKLILELKKSSCLCSCSSSFSKYLFRYG